MNNRTIIESYYRQHRDELLTFVSSRLGDSYIAQDLVQEAFLRLLQGNRPITEVTMPSLAYTVIRHLIADHYRHLCYQREYLSLMRGYLPAEYHIEPAIFARETAQCMERGLLRLSEPCRNIYRLHILDGMQVSDISQRLGQPYKAVEYRLGQARKEIRNYLRHIS